jgi:hypothetical protein
LVNGVKIENEVVNEKKKINNSFKNFA